MSLKNFEDQILDEAIGIGITKGIVNFFFGKKKEKKVETKAKTPTGYKHTAKYMGSEVIETENGNYGDFESLLTDNQSTIGIIFGARGTGKSAMAMRILEDVRAKTNRKCMAMGFNGSALPNWIKTVDKMEDLENDSFIVVDEGGVLFSARESMSDANKMVSSLLLIARHKNMSILFITQNSANMEINTIRQADYLLLKPSSLLQMHFERPIIGKIYEKIESKMKKYRKKYRGLTYVYSDSFQGYFNNGLASFWNEDISKNFSEV